VVLAELAEKIEPQKLAATARREDDPPTAQRLGFLLEHVGHGEKTGPLAQWLKNSRVRTIRLRAGDPLRGRKSEPWKLIVTKECDF
jgi:hypothetical protein